MADNVPITAGAGTTIASDDVAGVHYQRVKLDGGGDGASVAVLAGGGVEAAALRVTIANDSTGVVSVDDGGGALTVDGTVTVQDGGGAITVDGTVTVQDGGGAVTVDGTVTAELSATDNAVLDAIAAAVATEGDALGDGVLMQGDDGTDRTNVLVDAAGHLQVDVLTAPSTTVTATNLDIRDLTNADVVTAELSATDNAVLDAIEADTTTLAGAVAGGHVQADVLTAPAVRALTNADVVTAELSATDNAVLDAIAASLALLDNSIAAGNELQVDVVAALPAGDNNIGNVDVVTMPTVELKAGTASIGKLAANDGVDIGNVDVASMPTGANAAQVQGTVAHDSAAANNPVLLGGKAVNAPQAAVANADVVMLEADLNGRLIVAPYTMPEKEEHYTSAADITDTNDDEAFAAVASTCHYITHFSAMCSHATTGTWVYLKDNDTVIYSGYCAAAGGGFVATFPVPLKCASGVHVNVANATNSSATRVNVSGFQAP